MESADTQKILELLTRIEQKVDAIDRRVKEIEADAHRIKDEVKSQYPTTG
jgi:hypothetical protein